MLKSSLHNGVKIGWSHAWPYWSGDPLALVVLDVPSGLGNNGYNMIYYDYDSLYLLLST